MFNQKTTNFCKQLNIRLPIIQAPMSGGIITPTLINEVVKAGGLGSLPLGYLSIDEARQAIQKTKALTSKSFAVNIFIPSPVIHSPSKQVMKMLTYINEQRLSLGLPPLSAIPSWAEPDMQQLLQMIIDEEISIVSFTFGILKKPAMEMLLQKNIFVMGTATTVEEGLALEAAGCNAVIAQGYEAGGHRGGGFLEECSDGLIGSMVLIPQMVDSLHIPVIASGGIMDGRGIAAALTLGASAVQMGTAFLTCNESSASSMHKHLILDKPAESTCITSVFTGKPVRSFKNKFITLTEKKFDKEELPSYPLQHYITKDLRSNANKLGCSEFASLWSGQGTQLSRLLSVESLMLTLEEETIAAISELKVPENK